MKKRILVVHWDILQTPQLTNTREYTNHSQFPTYPIISSQYSSIQPTNLASQFPLYFNPYGMPPYWAKICCSLWNLKTVPKSKFYHDFDFNYRNYII